MPTRELRGMLTESQSFWPITSDCKRNECVQAFVQVKLGQHPIPRQFTCIGFHSYLHISECVRKDVTGQTTQCFADNLVHLVFVGHLILHNSGVL